MEPLWRLFSFACRFIVICIALILASTVGGLGLFVFLTACLMLLFVLR